MAILATKPTMSRIRSRMITEFSCRAEVSRAIADCSQEASQSLGARRGDSADVTRAAWF
jgi:hypothetical protein